MADAPAMVYVKMAVIPVRQRAVVGPKSYTYYNFSPWALVEERDVEDMKQIRVTLGCACNGNQRTLPLFATEADIIAGIVKPEWS